MSLGDTTHEGWVVVGLGNPGDDYTLSRHNAGRLVLELMVQQADASLTELGKHNAHVASMHFGNTPATILLPNTYMNKSGASVKTLVKTPTEAERLIVVYDDMDLPWGTVRIAFRRGSGGHNGVESIIKAVKTKDFVRVRIGVAPTDEEGKMRKPRGEDAVLKFIMGDFSKKEQDALPALAERIEKALTLIMNEGRQTAMNIVNAES